MSNENSLVIHLLDKEYRVACPAGEQDNLLAAARYLDEQMREVRDAGATVLCVHHDLQTVADYFDHALILNVHAIAHGAVDDVLTEEILQRAYGGRLAETEIRAIARSA